MNPLNGQHFVAGSNTYVYRFNYRFNNTPGARQTIVPAGRFTSLDGGKS